MSAMVPEYDDEDWDDSEYGDDGADLGYKGD